MWILQEVLLAQKIIVVCGTSSIDWAHLVILSSRIDDLAACKFFSDSFATDLQRSAGIRLIQERNSWSTFQRQKNGAKALLQLLRTSSTLECSEAKDKVYGLLGLVESLSAETDGEGIVVDYSRSTAAIFADTLRYLYNWLPKEELQNYEFKLGFVTLVSDALGGNDRYAVIEQRNGGFLQVDLHPNFANEMRLMLNESPTSLFMLLSRFELHGLSASEHRILLESLQNLERTLSASYRLTQFMLRRINPDALTEEALYKHLYRLRESAEQHRRWDQMKAIIKSTTKAEVGLSGLLLRSHEFMETPGFKEWQSLVNRATESFAHLLDVEIRLITGIVNWFLMKSQLSPPEVRGSSISGPIFDHALDVVSYFQESREDIWEIYIDTEVHMGEPPRKSDRWLHKTSQKPAAEESYLVALKGFLTKAKGCFDKIDRMAVPLSRRRTTIATMAQVLGVSEYVVEDATCY